MANFDKVILNGTTYTIPSGGGGTVDTQLSPTSTNAVQNKAIYDAVNVIKEWNVLGSQNLPIYVPQNAITEGTPFRFTIKDVYSYNGYIYLFFPILGNDNLSIFYRYDLNDLTSYEKWDTFGSDSDRFMTHMQNEKVLYDSTTGVFVFTASYNNKEGYSNFLYGNFRVAFDSTEYTDSDGNIANIVNFSYNEAEVAVKLTTPDVTPVKTIVEGLGDNEIFIPQYWNVDNFGSEGNLYIQLNNYNILSGQYGTSTQTQQLLRYDPNSFSYNYDKGLTFDYKKTVEPDITPEVNITDYDSYSGSDYININTNQLTVGIDFGTASNGSASFNFGDENNNTYEFMVEKWGDNININVSSYGMYYYSKQYQFPSDTSTAVITLDGAPFAMLTSFNKSFGDFDVISAVRIYNGTQTMSFDDMLADIDSKLAKVDEIDEKEEVAARALNDLNTRVNGKQPTLVSGTNIKTINNESILGSGNITIQGGGTTYTAGDGIDITSDVITNTREQRVLRYDDTITGVKAALQVVSPHWDYSDETVSDPANNLTFVNNVPAANADPYVQANFLDGTLMEFEITVYDENTSSSFIFEPGQVTGGVMLIYDEDRDEWVDEVVYGPTYDYSAFEEGEKVRMNSTMLSALLTAMQTDCPYETMEVQYNTYAWSSTKSVDAIHSGTAYQLAYNSDLTALAARVTALEAALSTISSALDTINGEVI